MTIQTKREPIIFITAFNWQLWFNGRPEQSADGHLGNVGRSPVHVQQTVSSPSGVQRDSAEQRRHRREPRRSRNSRHSGVQGV